jgi:hypothetical protein
MRAMMSAMRLGGSLSFACAVGLTVIMSASTAFADPESERKAEQLFQDSVKAIDAGRYADACPMLEESQKLDPAIGTQFNLADCYEHTGRLVTAWTLFLEVMTTARRTGKATREKEARDRAAALEPRLGHLLIKIEGSPAPDLSIVRDGLPVPRSRWGDEQLVDPGEPRVETRAPGRPAWTGHATVAEGAHVTVVVPAPRGETPPPVIGPGPPAEEHPGRVQRTIGLGLGGAGVIGIGIGSVFGVLAITRHSDADALCDPNRCASAEGQTAWHDATSAGTVSTIAFAAGAIALAAGVVVWLTAPRPSTTKAALR